MRHLLVIRLSALGDAAILAPVLRRWAAANTDICFTVAAPAMLAPLFEGMPNVAFLGVDKKQPAHRIYRQMKTVGADAVADIHQVAKVGRALLLLRLDALMHLSPLTVKHLRKGRLSRFFMLRHWSMRPRRPQYERYSDVFRRLGLKEPAANYPQPFHRPPATPPVIGIAPFSQHEGKVWPFEYIDRLAAMLNDRGYRVLLFGSRQEAPQLDTLASSLANVTSLAGRLSFRDELEQIRNLTLMVSMDSANMHFASAVGTPVVSIWGATHPDFGFYGYGQARENALCAGLPCQPCSAYGQRPCRLKNHPCLHAVTPEQVFRHIETVISGH